MSGVKVKLVLDPNFGDRLSQLPTDQVIWIVHSRVNEEARQKLDNARCSAVTIFGAGCENDETVLDAAMEMIDDHHDEFSEEGAWSDLTVIGISLTPSVRELLEGYGASLIEEAGGEIHAARSE
jgi:hypothetical protein